MSQLLNTKAPWNSCSRCRQLVSGGHLGEGKCSGVPRSVLPDWKSCRWIASDHQWESLKLGIIGF